MVKIILIKTEKQHFIKIDENIETLLTAEQQRTVYRQLCMSHILLKKIVNIYVNYNILQFSAIQEGQQKGDPIETTGLPTVFKIMSCV